MNEVFLIISIYLALKLALDMMQIYTIKHSEIDNQSSDLLGIDIHEETKSRDYNIAKLKLSIIKNLIYVSWLYLLLFGGVINELNIVLQSFFESEYIINLCVILITYLVMFVSILPVSYYSTFSVEANYGFNTSTHKLFLRDNIISVLMTVVLIMFISSIFFFIIRFENLWWLLMASTIFGIIVLSIFIYPNYISPLFNKFKNLENEEIKNEVKDLSNKTKFDISNLYVMDKSKRSKHPNAYFTGFKNNRRIVFYDTLIDLLSPSEIKAVLAHEIGHYKHNHVIKSLVLSTFVIFIGMYFLSYLINSNHYIMLLNLPLTESSQLLALVFTYQILSFFIDPLFSMLSRKNEYDADNYASEQVDSEYLVTSLIKLYKSNLSFLIPNKFYAMFYFSHPTVLERINNLRGNK